MKRKSTTNILAREYIVSALLILTRNKPLSSVSITELCEKAGVSRMTFYRNYDSIEDIFLCALSEIFDNYRSDEERSKLDGEFFDKVYLGHFFDYVYEHKELFNGIIKCGYGLTFLEMITDYVKMKWANKEDEYKLIAFAGALFNSCIYWAKNNYIIKKQTIIDSLANTYRIQATAVE
ncbi:MAG: TetR/AcrR family transcriptional regulator [Pseudobutyrivibrio sp.]|nr:TetR/AcrR family transcriptional regulator [Pseudobutyrivibrio sp.]